MTDGQHCFISYSTADALEFALKLADELEAGPPSYDAWVDKRALRPGDDWDEQIAEAIRNCKCLLFVMTDDSVTPHSVTKQEWTWALKYKKPVIPIHLHANVEMPFGLGSRHWVDFSINFEQGLARLRKQLQWLDTPEGALAQLKDRLTDAERDLKRVNPEDEARVQSEINDLKEAIKHQDFIIKNPDAAAKQTRKNIDAGLERERQPEKPISSTTSTKFINPPPVTAPDYFQGRTTETQEIAAYLRNDYQHIMTIIGRAGAGKTALVCHALNALEAGQLPDDLGEMKVDGIVYLSEITSHKINVANIYTDLLRLLPSDVANRLEMLYRDPKIETQDKFKALLDTFQQETVILLLDNFETLLDPETQSILDADLKEALETILCAHRHAVKILITTRVPLHELALLEPSRQYNKHLEDGLKFPYAENILRALDKDGRAGLRDASDELLARAREVTLGYPRALEALYAIISVDRYTSIEELLIYDLPDAVVEKLVGEAFSRLDSTGKMVMQALAIYNRPVPPTAIDFLLQYHISGIDSAPVLNRLVNMHFARRESGHYYLHPMDREYAIGRIPIGNRGKEIGKGARGRIWDQHALTLRAADYFFEARKPRQEWKKLDDLASQLAEFDLRSIAGDYNSAASVLNSISGKYLFVWGHYSMLIQMHKQIADKINDTDLFMDNLNGLGTAENSIGEAQNAIKYFETGLTTARETKDRRRESMFLGNLGNPWADLGEINKAIDYFEQALAMDREIGDRGGEGANICNLGNAWLDKGEINQAIEYYEQALVIFRERGERDGEGIALGNLGNSYVKLGEIRNGIGYIEQALKIAHELGNRSAEGRNLGNLGSAWSHLGEIRNAIQHYEQALTIVKEIGERKNEGAFIGNIGNVYDVLGEPEKAIELYEQQLAIAHEVGDRGCEEIALSHLAHVFLMNGQSSQAIDYANQALKIVLEMGIPATYEYGLLSQIYLLDGELDNAKIGAIEAQKFDELRHNHFISLLLGIITLRQDDPKISYDTFKKSIAQADEILAKTPDLYDTLDTKGLALCGLALCARDDGPSTIDRDKSIADAIETFRKARQIAPHAGVVKHVLRLFDELAKCDTDGILKDVRSAVAPTQPPPNPE